MHTHYQMTALCAKLAISLNQWQEVVTDMLAKDIGCPRLHRLRFKHLLKADLNLLVKISIAAALFGMVNSTDYLANHKQVDALVDLPTALYHRKS
jgi:hypothetical protein